MDRAAKGDLGSDLRAAAAVGSAILVATHDPSSPRWSPIASSCSRGGCVIADGAAADLLPWLVLRDRDRADRRRGAAARGRRPAAARADDDRGSAVTWQLASFALLALALVAGFAWYERARPSAKVVALVATLAALAGAGTSRLRAAAEREADDGHRPARGLCPRRRPRVRRRRGRGAGVHVFFGQGPFTPWQMAGWGAVGLFGALIARLFGRDLGRWPLARRLHARRHRLRRCSWTCTCGCSTRASTAGPSTRCSPAGPAGQPRPRGRQPRLLPGVSALCSCGRCSATATACRSNGSRCRPCRAGGGRDRLDGGPRRRRRRRAGRRSRQARAISTCGRRRTPTAGSARTAGAVEPAALQLGVLGLAASGHDPRRVRRNGRSAVDYIVRGIGQVRSLPDLERTILALAAARRSPRAGGRPRPRRRARAQAPP